MAIIYTPTFTAQFIYVTIWISPSQSHWKYIFNKKNDIWTTIFNNFGDNSLSLILSLYFYSLSSFFSLYCYCPIRREEKGCHPKLFKIGCQNITPLSTIILFISHTSLLSTIFLYFICIFQPAKQSEITLE